ncbi:MAG: LysR family transcriptional regulator [Raoultibacter sp.]
MNLSQLYYFRKLAELQHYTRAAKELYITQPTLSDAISSLEKELGVRLFQKDGRSIKLTVYGEAFNTYVQTALNELDSGIEEIQRLKGDLAGVINLGTTFTVQDDYLPGLINAYQESYGSVVNINTYQGFTNYLTQSLHNETLDIAFCGKRENEPDIEYFPILHRELVLGVRADHPLADRESIKPEELRDYDLLAYRQGTPIGEQMREIVEQYGLDKTMQLYDDDITMSSVISFDGNVGAIMLRSIGLKLFSNLKTIPIEGFKKDFYWVYLAYSKKHMLSQAVESFIEFVKVYDGNEAAAE